MKRLLVVTRHLLLCGMMPAAARAQHEHPGGTPPDDIGARACHVRDVVRGGRAVTISTKASRCCTRSGSPRPSAAFKGSSKKDPACAMAHWGIALSQWGNPFGGIEECQDGRDDTTGRSKARRRPGRRRRASGRTSTAVGQLFTADAIRAATRARIGRVRGGDGEARRATIPPTPRRGFSTRSRVNQTASPTDKTYAKQLKAAGILEPLFAQMPDHPGPGALHHPRLRRAAAGGEGARRGAAATRRSRPRCRTRCTCRRTPSRASAPGRSRSRPTAGPPRRPARATAPERNCTRSTTRPTRICRSRRTRRRKAVLDRAMSWRRRGRHGRRSRSGAGFAIAAIPARYALERGAWADAAALTPRPANTPYTEAITHFARAVGAARSGNPAAATADIERLAALRDKLKAMQGRVLDRAGGHSAPRRAGVADLREGQQGRRPRAAERGRRCRGRDRQVGGVARAAGAGARAVGYMLLDAGKRRRRRSPPSKRR